MNSTLDNTILRTGEYFDVAQYLHRALERHDGETLSDHILAGIKLESLPPRVLPVWLSVCHEPLPIVACLRQPFSRLGRRTATKVFCHRLKGEEAEALWSAVGGKEGLAHLLRTYSVREVRFLCRGLGWLGKACNNIVFIRKHVTELLQCLTNPSADTRDPRPLLDHYVCMLPACNEEFVRDWLTNDALPIPLSDRLLLSHPTLFQEKILAKLRSNDASHDFKFRFAEFFRRLPAEPSSIAGCSASMAFSVKALEIILSGTAPAWTNQLVNDEILLPLTQRLSTGKKQISFEFVKNVTALIAKWLNGSRISTRHLRWYENSFTFHMVKLWVRWPRELESALITVLSQHSSVTSVDVARVMELLPLTNRREFLKLAYRNISDIHIDIDNDEDLRKQRCPPWGQRIFLSLPYKDSIRFLDRLNTIYSEKEIIAGADMTLLRLKLQREDSNGYDQAVVAIEAKKKQAETSRDQGTRAASAKCALLYAIAAGYLSLFEEVLNWAQRFNKDPLTIKSLYGSEVFSHETAELLAAVPRTSRTSQVNKVSLKENLAKGNAIIAGLIRTACLGIHEPSFSANDWTHVWNILGKVVVRRIENAPILQRALAMTDDEVYSTVWADTLSTWINTEKTLLEHTGQWHSIQRFLLSGFNAPTIDMIVPASARFINELTICRNQLWTEHRRTQNTDVVTLADPWPKGLPVQSLLPIQLNDKVPLHGLTYLIQRAEKTVFMDRELARQAVTEDVDSRRAIGQFIDDYDSSVRYVIRSEASTSAHDRRVMQAWSHAVSNLSDHLISEADARRHWALVFDRYRSRSFRDLSRILERPEMLALPMDHGTDPIEWNPQPNLRQDQSARRELPLTVLEAHWTGPSTRPIEQWGAHFIASKSTPAGSPKPIFTGGLSTQRLLPQERETVVATALLFTEARNCIGSKLLSEPFPDALDPRFPAMFLDHEFLDWPTQDTHYASSALETMINDVPTSLLMRLANSMLQAAAVNESEQSRLHVQAFVILKRLANGDRTQAMLDLAQHLILEYPNQSAWHRAILNRGTLVNLQPTDAKSFLRKLCSGMRSRMETMQEQRSKETDPSAEKKAPLVKITTIKMLVQLMTQADYIGIADALEILETMLDGISHVDVRVAVIRSLADLLLGRSDQKTKTAILETFKRLIPIAAELNERRPMTDTSWSAAEKEKRPPEVYHGEPVLYHPSNAIPPTMEAFREVTMNLRNSGKDQLYHFMVDEILLPICKLSIEHNRRWTAIFLRQLGYDDSAVSIMPPSPAALYFLTSMLLQFYKVIPLEVLHLLDGIARAVTQPLPIIAEVNKRLSDDEKLRASNAGAHWHVLWHATMLPNGPLEWVNIADLLTREIESKRPDGVTTAHVQDFWRRYSTVFVNRGSDAESLLQRHTAVLQPALQADREQQKLWIVQRRPLLVDFVAYVDKLRTAKWQADLQRRPDVLPDIEELRLHLLSYPNLPSQLNDEGAKVDLFVREIKEVLQSYVKSETPYHLLLPNLKKALNRVSPSRYDFPIALKLGSLVETGSAAPSLVDRLCLELADDFLGNVLMRKGKQDPAAHEKVRVMMRQWKSSPVEDFRERGRKLEIVMIYRD